MPSNSSSARPELPILAFAYQDAWERWLDTQHASSFGLWLQIAKSGSGIPSVSYPEALEIALCYGWIDGQKKSLDETSWLQKFTPRGAKSIWSKVNCEKAEALGAAGKMRPAGQTAIDLAKADGRWQAAYSSPSRATVPADLQAMLDAHPEAAAFFASLNSGNRYAILWRLETAKRPETRQKRLEQFVQMLLRRETIHP
jgi:uncharacterized protein YdeI (YjbR/CyaY-like superfamily)